MEAQTTGKREIIGAAAGILLLSGAMDLVFAALGYWDKTVLWGTVLGTAAALLNFALMVSAAYSAAEKARTGDAAKGAATMTTSYVLRMAALFLLLAVCLRTGKFHAVATLLPLVFLRPALYLNELARHVFSKKGGEKEK